MIVKAKTLIGICLGEYSRTFLKVKSSTFDISGAIGISHDSYSKFSYAFVMYYFGFDYNYNNNEHFGLIREIGRISNTYTNLQKGEIYSNQNLYQHINIIIMLHGIV